MESKKRKSLLLYVSLGLITVFAGLYLLGRYSYQNSKNQNYIDPTEAYESSEEFFLRKRKAKILENAYNTSLELGNEYRDKREYEIAEYKYFDAKSIYPTAIEPRMALSRILFDKAINNSGDCWNAKKEVLYALKYIRRSENPSYYRELQMMKSKLNAHCGETNNYAFVDQIEIDFNNQ